jgi:hypothetical protein
VTRYRLPALALLVTVLVAVVAIAARSHPLGGGGSAGSPSAQFFDYGFTTVVLVFAAFAVIAISALLWKPPKGTQTNRPRSLLAALLFWIGAALVGIELASHHFLRRFHQLEQSLHLKTRNTQLPPVRGNKSGSHHQHAVQLRWQEIAIVLALLAAFGAAAYVASRRRPAPREWRLASQKAVSAALDESLDDLRSEPDLRKAIIAAYARMERALALAGLARHPAEAPLEYVERALGELQTSSGGIRRLTDLFEWAKFSPHEPDPSMRDEAIEALVAVRDELRAPAPEPEPVAA